MLKRKLVILSLLVVAFLICSQSALIFGAEKDFHTGNIVSDCIFLKEIGHTIKVIRDKDFCAERVFYHESDLCQGAGKEIEGKTGVISKTPAYPVGNQACSESIVVHHKKNPGYCFEYTSGGITRYIPPGCNL